MKNADKANLTVEKKGVFLRIPEDMYEHLLNLSAAATLVQRKQVSVPSMIFQILDDALKTGRTQINVSLKR